MPKGPRNVGAKKKVCLKSTAHISTGKILYPDANFIRHDITIPRRNKWGIGALTGHTSYVASARTHENELVTY